MSCFGAALCIQPSYASGHSNIVGLLSNYGKAHEEGSQYRTVLISYHNLTELAAGLGTVMRDMGPTEEAVVFYNRAVNLPPNRADHHDKCSNYIQRSKLY